MKRTPGSHEQAELTAALSNFTPLELVQLSNHMQDLMAQSVTQAQLDLIRRERFGTPEQVESYGRALDLYTRGQVLIDAVRNYLSVAEANASRTRR